jgi:hypothetical protein
VAGVAVGLARTIAAAAALWQWSQAPPDAAVRSEETPILRRDPVRALAIEQGLLPDGEAREEPLEALWFEPTPPAEDAGGAAAATAADPPDAAAPAAPAAPVAAP